MRGTAYYQTRIGTVQIEYGDGKITGLRIVPQTGSAGRRTSLTEEAFRQLEEYFEGQRRSFELPVEPAGTDFQKTVWAALQQIPYGQTRSYSQVAGAVGRPKAARAVGNAAGKNPVWIVIPCHRMVGSNGALTGYAGGLMVKQALLELEREEKQLTNSRKLI